MLFLGRLFQNKNTLDTGEQCYIMETYLGLGINIIVPGKSRKIDENIYEYYIPFRSVPFRFVPFRSVPLHYITLY